MSWRIERTTGPSAREPSGIVMGTSGIVTGTSGIAIEAQRHCHAGPVALLWGGSDIVMQGASGIAMGVQGKEPSAGCEGSNDPGSAMK